MPPTVLPPIAAPPDHPVRAAVADPGLREELLRQALSYFAEKLAHRPAALRVEEAEEAVQETLHRALNGMAKFHPDSGKSVAGWIHGILKNVCFEKRRKLGRLPKQPSSDPGAWDRLAARMESAAAPEELASMLNRLGEIDRQIMTWHHLDGDSHFEIAAKLGISSGASRTRLARAMMELKKHGLEKEVAR